MARIQGGITGIPSGKVGNVVFVNREGSPYIRVVPVYTKGSWTMNQKQHRLRFKKVTEFCRQYRMNIIRPIWNLLPGKASGYGKFLKANMPAFGRDGKLIDKSMLHFSSGVLPLPYHLKAERTEGQNNTIYMTWANDAMLPQQQQYDELLYMAAKGDEFTGPYAAGLKRRDCGGVFDLPDDIENADALYLFFASGDRGSFSPDKYFSL